MKQLKTLAADLSAAARTMILGDFQPGSTAIGRPVRGYLSNFISASKRSPFAKLRDDHDLIDATASDEPVFTFSRLVGGVALVVSLRPCADSRLAAAVDYGGGL